MLRATINRKSTPLYTLVLLLTVVLLNSSSATEAQAQTNIMDLTKHIFTTGGGPEGIAVTPDGTTRVNTNSLDGSVTVATQGKADKTVPVENKPWDIIVDKFYGNNENDSANTNANSGSVTIVRNIDSTPTLGPSFSVDSPAGLTSADFDKNDKPDIAIAQSLCEKLTPAPIGGPSG